MWPEVTVPSRAQPDQEAQPQNRRKTEGKGSEVSGSGLGEQCESSFLLSLKKPGWYWPVLVRRAGDLALNTSGLIGMVQGLHMVGL